MGLGVSTIAILHLGACLWSALGYLEDEIPYTWIYRFKFQDKTPLEIYLIAIYYCFVALTTVGYGDITAFTIPEILFTIMWMLFGVAFYSFTIGIISAFFTSIDNKSSLLAKRI
jgi:Ion channel